LSLQTAKLLRRLLGELVHELAIGMMIYFTGALILLNRLPAWMAHLGRFTPIGQRVVALRAVLIDRQ
jgi:hypothetical protein